MPNSGGPGKAGGKAGIEAESQIIFDSEPNQNLHDHDLVSGFTIASTSELRVEHCPLALLTSSNTSVNKPTAST